MDNGPFCFAERAAEVAIVDSSSFCPFGRISLNTNVAAPLVAISRPLSRSRPPV